MQSCSFPLGILERARVEICQPNKVFVKGTELKSISQLIVVLGICGVIAAQSGNGSLKGKVTDQTGAVIPQAKVTAVSADGKHTTATSDGAGLFEIGSLAPGSYIVFVEANGFAPYRQDAVMV